MAYKRKRSIRKRMGKKRKPYRRKYPMYRQLDSNRMNVCLRTADTLIANSNLSEQYVSYRFQLSACLNYTNYRDMWDQYKINKVVVTWTPVRTQSVVQQVDDVTPSTTTNVPSYVVAKDIDDLTQISYEDVKSRYGAVERIATKGFKMVLKPAMLTEVYQGPVSTAYSPQYNTWLDTANNTVPHYGIRFAIESAEPSGYYALECKTWIYVSFKNRVI